MSEDFEDQRTGSLVPSQGIEASFLWLAVGIVGMVFLFFAVLGRSSSEKTPTYETESQIVPRDQRDAPNNQPELGAGSMDEPTEP